MTGSLIFLSKGLIGIGPVSVLTGKEIAMSKGNHRKGNKEIKKPKQEKPKVLATAMSGAGKSTPNIGGKKIG
jgi:hypothetical protein